jgi:hypothetical protein
LYKNRKFYIIIADKIFGARVYDADNLRQKGAVPPYGTINSYSAGGSASVFFLDIFLFPHYISKLESADIAWIVNLAPMSKVTLVKCIAGISLQV